MTLSIHAIARDTFVPMLTSLDEILGKALVHADAARLPDARLAPDMFTLAQQVQQACFYALDAFARLAGKPSVDYPAAQATLVALRAQIAGTLGTLRAVPASALDEERDCSISIPGAVIEMTSTRFLLGWALPHFYFHVVTAYDILRHRGLAIGKNDYQSQVAGFIRAT